MSDQSNLFASNEIVGALATKELSENDVKAFASNPQEILASNFNIDVSHIDINVIENTNNDVNLALPYYSMVDTMQAEMLKDENLEKIAGGEIIIAICAFAGAAIGLSLVPAAAGGTLIATGIAVGGLVGGGIGAAVLAGTAAGAIIGGTGSGSSGSKSIKVGAADSSATKSSGGGGK